MKIYIYIYISPTKEEELKRKHELNKLVKRVKNVYNLKCVIINLNLVNYHIFKK